MVIDYIRMVVITLLCVGFLIFTTNGVSSQNIENFVSDAQENLFPCQTPDARKGFCVSIFDCPELIKLVHEEGRVASKIAKQSICLGCQDNEILVCCKKPGNTVLYLPPPEKITPTDSKCNGSLEEQKSKNVKKLQKNLKYCGGQSADYKLNTRATPGVIDIDEYPWLVQIKHTSKELISMRCTGVIIEKRYILTTSKCGYQAQTALLGQYSFKESVSCMMKGGERVCTDPIQELSVEVVAHSNLAQDDQYGLALLKVNKSIVYTDYVRPICLPLNRTELSTTKDSLIASGWTGKHKDNWHVLKKNYTDFVKDGNGNKKESKYTRLPAKKCFKIDEQLKEKIMEGNINLTCLSPSYYISGPYCAFDFGGPLMYENESNSWYLDGLIGNSHQENDPMCASGKLIEIYLTPKLIDFIISNVN